jgi:alpha-galactosidase
MLVIPCDGDDASAGNNLLRRLLLEHYLPRLKGELVMPPAAQCLQAYYYLTGKASAAFEMTALPKVAATGAEAYWIDACWYGVGQEWWQEVGSWVVNRERFPDGLKPISDAAHEAGMKFVLWFEPERVRPGSLIHREHPEFLLATDRNPENLLLDLGMPEAREYITDLISGLITECGVDIYRQDFNFDPLPYWQAADAPDRVGITQIRYIEGLYAFWDELRRRHPNIWIDNCSSGGRRIDLEMMSRSLPLWPSDFPDVGGLQSGRGLHVGDQCINAGLACWVPLFGGGVWNFTPYGTRGEIIGGFTFGFHIEHADFPADGREDVTHSNDVLAKGKTLLDDDFPLAKVRAAVEEWKRVRPFFLGDFYLLLPLTVSYHDWCAWQFHREDMDAGVALFFRRHQSPFPTMHASMRRIVPAAQYDVSLSPGYDETPRRRMSGKDLAAISVTIPEAPGSVLLRYSRAR